ncbi:MAG: glycosyltransferase [Candidatus Omnitrophota bacterium]|nr:glycosyltransferase [Candidatus Omnitrophota bacterium]
MPKVSVILPAYNGEKFIAAALDSVLGQAYTDYEIIVVDDGSKDRTADILSRYTGKVKIISQENGGIAKARNTAIENSEGKYLAFLDQDDTWLPDKLALQVALMESDSSLGLVYTDVYITNDKGAELLSFKLRKPHRGIAAEELFLNNFIATSSVMTKKECFEKVGLFDQSLSPCLDYDRWLNIAALYKIDYVDKPLARFRDHISTFRKNETVTAEKIVATLRRFIDNHPDIKRAMGMKASRVVAYYSINLGNKYLARGDFKKAFSAFRAALETGEPIGAFFYIVFSILRESAKNFLRLIKSKITKFARKA